MKIYLATWLLEPSQGTTLTLINAKQRLTSYYHTKEKKDDFSEYLKTGQVAKK